MQDSILARRDFRGLSKTRIFLDDQGKFLEDGSMLFGREKEGSFVNTPRQRPDPIRKRLNHRRVPVARYIYQRRPRDVERSRRGGAPIQSDAWTNSAQARRDRTGVFTLKNGGEGKRGLFQSCFNRVSLRTAQP